jgi:hypothetical protein
MRRIVLAAIVLLLAPYTLVSSPAFETAAQLKGGKFAVCRLGSVSNLSLRITL